MNLEYLKPKYFSCKIVANYKICAKSHQYKFCKAFKNQSFINCLKTWKCNINT